MRWEIKDIVIAAILSYIGVTILNYLLHLLSPSIGILKTGPAFVLILVAIVLVMLFTYARNGFNKEEIYALIAILVTMVGIYFVVKHFLPDLFSIFPNSTREVFNALTNGL